MLDEPHLKEEGAGALSVSTPVLYYGPSRMNSVDKRADCTTLIVLDVDAANHDRASAGCGEEMRWRG